jgi:FAD/FMN-containing dehydrogenase
MKNTILEKLELKIQGDIHSTKDFREFYSVDASSYKIIPKIIVIPKNEKDVIETVKIAKKMKTSVTVRGAGTGLVGSALNTGIILDMKNFDSIKLGENYVNVGTGTIKGKLDKKLETSKKFFAPNPSISLKYGSVIDNVLEITYVDGDGNKISLPKNKKKSKEIIDITNSIDYKNFPNVTKNSSGYRLDKIKTINDTHKIIIGSEGTLGVILSAKLKIQNIPKKRILFVIEYDSIIKAAKNCTRINSTSPSAVEFVDKTTLKQIKYKFDKKSKCLLFVEYDNKIASNEKRFREIVTGKIVKKLQSKSEIVKWWRYRDSSLYYSLKSIKKENKIPHIIEDAAVSIENLPKLFLILNKINKKYKTKSIVYGHAGNGNVHIRLISNRKKIHTVKKIATEYFHEILKMRGTITAEHGDGLARSEFIKKQYGEKNYKIFKKIKNYFDPENILNPGKIITTKSTIVKNLEKF